MIELILAENIPEIAKSGDSVILKDDGTFEIKKSDDDIEKEKARKLQMEGYAKRHPTPEDAGEAAARQENYDKEETKKADKPFESDETHEEDNLKKFDPRIEKYLPNDKAKAWSILEKFYKTNKYFDANEVLKEFINKVALCPDVTEKFDKIMEGWMKDGEADVSTVEKIINSCKKEEGNVVVKTIIDEVLKEKHGAAHSSHAQTCPVCRRDIDDDMPKKMKERLEGKKEELTKEKNKPDRDTKWVDEMVASRDLPKQEPFKPNKPDRDTKWVDDMVRSGELPKQKPLKIPKNK